MPPKNRLPKYQADMSAVVAEMGALLEVASAQENGALTEAQRTAYDALEAKRVALAETVARETALREHERTAPAADEPIRGVQLRADRDKKQRGFACHRDFLMAVMENAGLQSRADVADERLRGLAVFDKDDKASAGELAFLLPTAWTPRSLMATVGSDEQGEYDDRYGGFAVPTTRLPGILQVGFEGDPTAGLTQSIPMGSPTVEIMARTDKDHTTSVSGGFTVTRRAEAVAMTASRSALEMVTLKAASLFGFAAMTEELRTDSPQSFVAIVDTGFRTQFPAHMLNEKLRGKGGNEYLGVLTALAASSLGPTISIAKETNQVADTIVSDNVIKAAARCWGLGNAIWLANHDTRPQLMKLSIAVGTAGQLIYTPSAQMGFPDMLLGRPVYYTEYAATIGDQGDLGLYNFTQYLDGLYQPLMSAESVHVRFMNHEMVYKFWLRNAGAPWWRTALTPAKSTATLSPFVVLDAR